MPPYRESVSDIRFESKHHQSHQAGAAEYEEHLGEVTASQEGNHQIRCEEYHGRTEVTHDGKASQTEYAEAQEYGEILSLLQLIQRSGTDEYERDLYEFGRLECKSAQTDPVLGSICDRTDCQIEDEQEYARAEKYRDKLLGFVQVTKEPAHCEEEHDAEQDADGLLQYCIWISRRGQRKT